MDQWNNNVDEEIRIPIKDFHTKAEWRPLGKNSWIEAVERTRQVAGIPAPLKTVTEYGIAYADGKVDDVYYKDEGDALRNLQVMRKELKSYGVPEEYWPVLMERTVETVTSSWKIRSA